MHGGMAGGMFGGGKFGGGYGGGLYGLSKGLMGAMGGLYGGLGGLYGGMGGKYGGHGMGGKEQLEATIEVLRAPDFVTTTALIVFTETAPSTSFQICPRGAILTG